MGVRLEVPSSLHRIRNLQKKLSVKELYVRVWGAEESTAYFLGSLPVPQVICNFFYYNPE
jgi:hypothetical protein